MSSGELRVAMIGHAFMGAAHSHAWRTAPHVFDLPLRPVMSVLCGRSVTPAIGATKRLLRNRWEPMVGVEIGMKLAASRGKETQMRWRKRAFYSEPGTSIKSVRRASC